MKLKKNFYYLIIIAITLILISFFIANYFISQNKTSKLLNTLTTINTSYDTLLKEKKYDFNSSYTIGQSSALKLDEAYKKSSALSGNYADYLPLLELYKNFYSNFNLLKDKSNSSPEYIKNLTSSIQNLEDIKDFYDSHKSIVSKLSGFNNFYEFNNQLLTNLLDTSKDLLNSDITKLIQSDYNYALNKFYASASLLTQDLKPALTHCYDTKGSLDNILNDIYKKQATLEELLKDCSTLSVPQSLYSSYEDFQSIINLCSIYLNSMRETIVSESSSPSYDKKIDDIYDNAFSKRQDLISSLNTYKEKYSNIIK
ncbi:hypothetical protein [Clostridium paridis]|uniref:DUF3829 domain-containing protein n=1 Tax=Clostridium paridis TaxID=2803863 RepID=A0A937FK06_9CLOT|nr:hypothetical protein [Clostridium paridis]MBL4933858.1 hypothetical protein [Clostridium paridis]